MVTYKYAKADLSSPIDNAALASLPAFFRERIGKKKNPEAKAESFLGAKILMELLSKCGISPDSLDFKADENGRPYTEKKVTVQKENTLPIHFFNKEDEKKHSAEKNAKIDFNISHSRGEVAVALSVGEDARVGIDIEQIERRNQKMLAERWFSENEFSFFEDNGCSPIAFTKIWTRKEAMLKFTGEGIVKDLSRADIFRLPPHLEFTEITDADGCIITICHRKGEKINKL